MFDVDGNLNPSPVTQCIQLTYSYYGISIISSIGRCYNGSIYSLHTMKTKVITHQRPQVMYSIDIGSNNRDFWVKHEAVLEMAAKVSKLTGGCTLVDSVGLWADVDRADKDSYDKYNVGTERNVQLQVKTEVGKEAKTEERIVESVVEMAQEYPEFEINWVCGHKVTAEGHTVAFNFSVEDNL